MQKFFRIILFFFRLLFGATFVISGVFKLVDPVGTGLVVSEYFTSFGTAFLKPVSTAAGVCLSISELVIGLAVLTRLRIRFFSTAALVLTLIFTGVTFVLYKFSPIQDCGCFGEAVHLSNSQTFFKNLILLVFIVPVFFFRKRYGQVARPGAEWSFLASYAVLALVLSICLVNTCPLSDFGDFKPGTDIRDEVSQTWSGNSGDVYVYEKDGVKKGFLISEIPDSSWRFIEVVSSDDGVEDSHSFDFAVTNADGLYVTDSILNHNGPVVLFTVSDPEELSDEDEDMIIETASALDSAGIWTMILTAGGIPVNDTLSELFAYSDYKTLISLCRSNGGIVVLNSGVVVGKGYCGEYTQDELISLFESDPDELVSFSSIRGNILLEMIFVIILLSVLIFRYFCGLKRDRFKIGKV